MNFDLLSKKETQVNDMEKVEFKSLGDFDLEYFRQIEGEGGWVALGQENCTNQQYFTVYGNNNEKLGIVGVYDADSEKNVTHTVVDRKHRGRGLAAKFKMELMNKLNLSFITIIINIDNIASIKATEKLPGVKRISDEQYERDFHKAKYIYEK